MTPRCFLALLLLSGQALAYDMSGSSSDLTPEKMAQIKREQKQAVDEVNKAHGNKKSSEMSSDERRAVIQQQGAAERKVLEQHGIDAKEFTVRSAKMSRDERARMAAADKALEQQEAEKKKKDQEAAEPREIEIQRGFSNQDPVELESTPHY